MTKARFMTNCVVGIAAMFVWIAVPASADEVAIEIGNFTFGPHELKVKSGTTVTWVNEDDIPIPWFRSITSAPRRSTVTTSSHSRSRHRALINTFVPCIRT